ncbi:MAG: hypothetical protein QXJ19_02180 [Candidatus Bathyarchaeia archaeon]
MLKFAIILSFISIVLIIAAPFTIFIYQIANKPNCISISIENVVPLDDNRFSVRVTLQYALDITLSRVRIMIGNTEVIFEDVVKGAVSKDVVLTLSDIQQGIKEEEIVIAGLFKCLFKFT